jgi:integrase
MAVYKRGGVWWYEFTFNGERVRESTKQGNRRVAEQMEAAKRTALAKGEVGIQNHKKIPTLRQFAPRFEKHIEAACAEKPLTVEFYKSKLRVLLGYEPLAGARLDRIDEATIEGYVQNRLRSSSRRKRQIAPATVNRELATIRRLLRLAHEWREIQRVPRIRLLRGERNREFTLSPDLELAYLQVLPPVLADVATVLLDTGLRLGELLSLAWPQVHLEPANGARFGYVTVLSGKAKSGRSRNVPLTERAVAVLRRWGPAEGGLVFHREGGAALSATWLDQQHARARDAMKLPKEFVLHCLRHTFGTRLGESGADAFTIMRLMGHSTVTVSQRYVHPTPETLEAAVERMAGLKLQKLPTNSPTVKGVEIEVVQ